MNRGPLLILSSAVLFGGTFPVIRYGLEQGGLPPYGFAYYRFALAALVMIAYAVARRRFAPALFRDARLLLLAGLVAFAYLLQFAAQDRTSAIKTSLLVNVNVLTVAILAYVFLKERVRKETLAAIALGLLGSFLLSTNGDVATLRFSNREFVGDLLAFSSGICWAVYTVAFKRLLRDHPATDGIALAAVLFALIGVLLLPVAAFTRQLVFPVGLEGALALVYLGVLGTVAFLMWQEGMRFVEATGASVLLLVEIVVAFAISTAFLGERLEAWGLVGAVGILVAAYLAGRNPTKSAATVSPSTE